MVFREFKGAITEQFVLQELKTIEDSSMGTMPVFYWGREDGKCEVDFVVQWQNEIVPIEVKSGIHKKSKSLDIYRDLYKPAHAVRATMNNFGITAGFYSVPLYMMASIGDILFS